MADDLEEYAYVDRVKDVYQSLRDADGIDQADVADLTIAIIQEEAKDRRTVQMDARKDQRVQAMHGRGDAGDWRDEPATDAQKQVLDNLGVSYDDDLTKGDASDLIDEARAEQ